MNEKRRFDRAETTPPPQRKESTNSTGRPRWCALGASLQDKPSYMYEHSAKVKPALKCPATNTKLPAFTRVDQSLVCFALLFVCHYFFFYRRRHARSRFCDVPDSPNQTVKVKRAIMELCPTTTNFTEGSIVHVHVGLLHAVRQLQKKQLVAG